MSERGLRMRVLLPTHDGLADDVARAVPEAVVVRYAGAETTGLDDVSFYCLPYMGDDACRSLVARLPALKVIQSLSIGVDDIKSIVPAGVVLCNGRGLHHEESTAELAVLLILASLRRLPTFIRAQQEHVWRHGRGDSLDGKNVLVVGFGPLGAAVSRYLSALGARVAVASRTPRDGVASLTELPRLAREVDVLVACLPAKPETTGLVGAEVLSALPDGALVVNVGRGPTVDADALRVEVVRGRLRAALDVTDPEPLPPAAPEWALPNVLVTPHVGGDTTAFVERAREFLIAQVQRHVKGEELHNLVQLG